MPVSEAAFADYMGCKGLDVLGGGEYKRFLYQCVERQDAWAVRVHGAVGQVSGAVREIQGLVERVRQTQTPLARVCKEVVTAMHAPTRRAKTLQQCVLTGVWSAACIDVSRAAKTETPVMVHERFGYFVLMLYYVHRLEHVARSVAKSWMAEQPDAAELDLAALAERWRGETQLFRDMWQRFEVAWAHVDASLRAWLVK